MKRIILLLAVVTLSGCTTLQTLIPSFWDDNQSQKIVDIQLTVDRIDCSQPQLAQASRLRDELRWFELYSTSKGRTQQDVLRVLEPMKETAEDWYKRSLDAQGSRGYCDIKKKILQQQSDRAARAVLGRW